MKDSDLKLLLADRIWITVAALHQEFPQQEDFSKEEIRDKMRNSGLMDGVNPGSVAAHLKEHMVANVPPSTSKYRMLFKTPSERLRLFRPDDWVDPKRRTRNLSKQTPNREELPEKYLPLLDWYSEWCERNKTPIQKRYDDDPLIRLIGSGRHIWAEEHADEYVENLRREDI